MPHKAPRSVSSALRMTGLWSKPTRPATIEFISKGRVVQAESNVRSSCYLIRGDEGYIRARVTRSDPSWRFIDGGVGYTRSAWTNPIYVIG